VLAVCANKNVPEWKSLSLLGKLALKDTFSKYSGDYNHDHLTETAIGLRLSQSGSF
jgi:hypothetical protein